MLKYTICFIKQGDKVLLMNREYPSWMGAWNGVGGKIEGNESPRSSVIREVMEETDIELELEKVHFKGIITWSVDGGRLGGMYTYMVDLPLDYEYETPIKTREGILDWKEITWIKHPDNIGVAYNIPKSLDKILFEENCYEHHCIYQHGKLTSHESFNIDKSIEDIRDSEMIRSIIVSKSKLYIEK